MASAAAQSEIAATLKPPSTPTTKHSKHMSPSSRESGHIIGWSCLTASKIICHFFTKPSHGKRGCEPRDCLAIVAKSDADGDLRSDLAASPSLAGLGAVFGEAAIESAHFLYFPYNTRDGNCLKTFPNAIFQPPSKRLISQQILPLRQGLMVAWYSPCPNRATAIR